MTKVATKSTRGRREALNIVTRANFEKVLPQVLAMLERASFVTIDTELSGLCAYRSNRYSIFDDLQQRYTKLADSASHFALLQFGLGIFSFDAAKQKCSSSVYSFHLFPLASAGQPERKFTMQVSSVAFLAEHNFNFNATFNEGIGYLSLAEEQAQRARIDPDGAGGRVEREKPGFVELRKTEDREFVRGVMERVEEWVAGGAIGRLDLAPCNGYQRLLTYQQIELKFSDRLMVSKVSVPSGSPYLSVSAPGAERRQTIEAEEREKLLSKLRGDVGFRRVIDRIAELKLPIVGHNCFLDLCHMYDKFIGKLPGKLSDFKAELHRHFPTVLDTKLIAAADKDLSGAGSFGLSDIVAYFGDCREELLAAPGLHSLTEQFHDAGYDAYCTGLAFIGMAHKFSGGTQLDPLAVFLGAAGPARFANRLFVMQSPYEGGLNVTGDDVEPDRSHIFILTEFPDKWRNSSIADALSRLFRSDDFSVQMSNTTASEAFVSFKSDGFRENATVQAGIADGRLVVEGIECRWRSFEASRAPVVLGKRDSDETN